jgi:hypothetical protein
VGHSEIAVMNADGSEIRRLTHDCWDDGQSTWIPNDAAVRTLPVWDDGSDAGCTTCSGSTEPPPTPDLSGSCPEQSYFLYADFDFDGNGAPDVAELRCVDGAWRVKVKWSGSDPPVTTVVPISDCTATCSLFAAPDLEGDGAAELGIEIGGETARQVEFLRLDPSGASTEPLTIVGDGAPGFPSNSTAVFPYRGAVTHAANLTCEDRTDGRVVVSTTAESSSGTAPWTIRTTDLALEADGFHVISSVESTNESADIGPSDEVCGFRV